MTLMSKKFKHTEKSIQTALNIDNQTMITCRERIFFTHFANTLQSLELFLDLEDAPTEMTTITGDMERTISMIKDPFEYEVTLVYFMGFHNLATSAMSIWMFKNNSQHTKSDKLKLEILSLVTRLKTTEEAEEKTDDSEVINPETISNRVDLVKKSNFNFNNYMNLLGYPMPTRDYHDVDAILRGVFNENEEL